MEAKNAWDDGAGDGPPVVVKWAASWLTPLPSSRHPVLPVRLEVLGVPATAILERVRYVLYIRHSVMRLSVCLSSYLLAHVHVGVVRLAGCMRG